MFYQARPLKPDYRDAIVLDPHKQRFHTLQIKPLSHFSFQKIFFSFVRWRASLESVKVMNSPVSTADLNNVSEKTF